MLTAAGHALFLAPNRFQAATASASSEKSGAAASSVLIPRVDSGWQPVDFQATRTLTLARSSSSKVNAVALGAVTVENLDPANVSIQVELDTQASFATATIWGPDPLVIDSGAAPATRHDLLQPNLGPEPFETTDLMAQSRLHWLATGAAVEASHVRFTFSHTETPSASQGFRVAWAIGGWGWQPDINIQAGSIRREVIHRSNNETLRAWRGDLEAAHDADVYIRLLRRFMEMEGGANRLFFALLGIEWKHLFYDTAGMYTFAEFSPSWMAGVLDSQSFAHRLSFRLIERFNGETET